jgi:hypothetical protein
MDTDSSCLYDRRSKDLGVDMDKILQPLADNPRGLFVANLAASVVVLVWVLGIEKRQRDSIAWQGWVGFWIGTCVFYLLKSVWPSRDGTVMFTGLYLATLSLLIALNIRYKAVKLWLVCALVVASVAADSIAVRIWEVSGWHQALTGTALLMWAWAIRCRDVGKSVVIIAYAVLQLPVQPFLDFLNISTVDYAAFVKLNYAACIVLKIPLIPAVYLACRRHEAE